MDLGDLYCTNSLVECFSGVQVPEYITKFNRKGGPAAWKARQSGETPTGDPVEMARKQFEIAAKAGCNLGFKWLNRLEQEEKQLLSVLKTDAA